MQTCKLMCSFNFARQVAVPNFFLEDVLPCKWNVMKEQLSTVLDSDMNLMSSTFIKAHA